MSVAKSSMVSVRKVVSGIQAGKKFGKLKVLGYAFSRGMTPGATNKKWHVVCRCECRRVRVVAVANIKSGVSNSCPHCVPPPPGNVTHGKSGTRLHGIWCGMKARCRDLNDKNYGGRGISVCKEWEVDFKKFYDWAIANGYRDGLTLDRFPDQNGNYEPSNCRWATAIEQGGNKRSNYLISAFGETKIFSDWVRDPRCVVSKQLLSLRLSHGWQPEKAIETIAKVYRSAVD